MFSLLVENNSVVFFLYRRDASGREGNGCLLPKGRLCSEAEKLKGNREEKLPNTSAREGRRVKQSMACSSMEHYIIGPT
jgi:hypothetical protein